MADSRNDALRDRTTVVRLNPAAVTLLALITAALIASMVKIAFAAEADRIDEPGRVLEGVNRALWGKFDRAFVTAFCGVFYPVERRLRYASAGHPPAHVRRWTDGSGQLQDDATLVVVDVTPHQHVA